MTELQRLQKEIDKCRKQHGDVSCWDCNCEYSKKGDYHSCPRLVAHAARISYCSKNNIPTEQW